MIPNSSESVVRSPVFVSQKGGAIDAIPRTALSFLTLIKSVDISERQSLNNHEERERVIYD